MDSTFFLIQDFYRLVMVLVTLTALYCGLKYRRSLLLLSGYLAVNAVGEWLAIQAPHWHINNHFIYAGSILLHSAFLLLYFGNPKQPLYARLIYIAGFLFFAAWYISNQAWKMSFRFSGNSFVDYYGVLAVCAMAFAWISVYRQPLKTTGLQLLMAVSFLLYYVLGLANSSLIVHPSSFGQLSDEYLFWAPMLLALAFYLSLLLIMFFEMRRLKKEKP